MKRRTLGSIAIIGVFLFSSIASVAWAGDEELLDFVNDCTTTFDVLDIDVGLNSTAARNIITHRDGADKSCGTAGDDLFDSVQELDAVPDVDENALEKLLDYTAPSEGSMPCFKVNMMKAVDKIKRGVKRDKTKIKGTLNLNLGVSPSIPHLQKLL